MQYHIQPVKKEKNGFINLTNYSLNEKTFSFWIRVHRNQGYAIRKIDCNKIIIQKNNMNYICTKDTNPAA